LSTPKSPICDSLLQGFRGLFVLLFQFLELLPQVTVLLGGGACVQKDHNRDYSNPFRIESAAHVLTVRPP